MNRDDYSRYYSYGDAGRRNNNRKRRKKVKWMKFALVIVFVILVFIAVAAIAKGRSGRLEEAAGEAGENQAEESSTVQYGNVTVDQQIIDIGTARSGEKLEALNGIVVHYVANPGSTAQDNHDYFATDGTTVCSHFVIGLEGEIIQCLPLDEKSAASNERNKDTISIEVCHPDDTGEFTVAGYNALVMLCAWICDTANLDTSCILRHYDVTGKACPKYFVDNPEEWDQFLEHVKKWM